MTLELLVRSSQICTLESEKSKFDENAVDSRCEVKTQHVRETAERLAVNNEVSVRDPSQFRARKNGLELVL